MVTEVSHISVTEKKHLFAHTVSANQIMSGQVTSRIITKIYQTISRYRLVTYSDRHCSSDSRSIECCLQFPHIVELNRLFLRSC